MNLMFLDKLSEAGILSILAGAIAYTLCLFYLEVSVCDDKTERSVAIAVTVGLTVMAIKEKLFVEKEKKNVKSD